ncbi:MAG: outer membrane beta-barrel protein [Muribaculaceae bacterium]|nr:outer membrane beta-barrel protein [Muribaculaceae bacterium]
MKKILFVLLFVCAALGMSAQRSHGFGGKVDVGYGFKTGDSFNSINVNLMPGYHLNPNWFLGVGVGYQNVDVNSIEGNSNGNLSLIPVFAHVQWGVNIEDSQFSPFVGVRAGYAIGSKKYDILSVNFLKLEGGAMGNIEAGCKYSLGATALSLSAYFEYVDFTISSDLVANKLAVVGENQNVGIRLGLEF